MGSAPSLPQFLAAAEFQTENVSGRRYTEDWGAGKFLRQVLYVVTKLDPKVRSVR